jgi:hypothetical protein
VIVFKCNAHNFQQIAEDRGQKRRKECITLNLYGTTDDDDGGKCGMPWHERLHNTTTSSKPAAVVVVVCFDLYEQARTNMYQDCLYQIILGKIRKAS